MIATAQATAYWTPTPADLPNIEPVARHYWASVTAPQRGWAVEAIAAFGADIRSVLEIGCQCGPNLLALRRARPDVRLMGVDVNAAALAAGRRFFAADGIHDVVLREGTIPEALAHQPPPDVVLSVYCLAYIGPDRIDETLLACLRLARVGLVLIEPMLPPGEADETTVEGSSFVEWRHNYLSLLAGAAEALDTPIRIAWVTKPRVHRLGHVLIVQKEAVRAV